MYPNLFGNSLLPEPLGYTPPRNNFAPGPTTISAVADAWGGTILGGNGLDHPTHVLNLGNTYHKACLSRIILEDYIILLAMLASDPLGHVIRGDMIVISTPWERILWLIETSGNNLKQVRKAYLYSKMIDVVIL